MSEQERRRVDPAFELRPPHETRGGLPAVIEHAPQPRRWWRRLPVTIIVLTLLVSGGAGIGWSWWRHHQMQLPAGFAYGNGRLEADAIDIDTKFAGRIAKLLVDEGDIVTAGQVVAMMDTRDLDASLKKSQALVSQAERALEEAKANLTQQRTQVALAQPLVVTLPPEPSGYCRQTLSCVGRSATASTKRTSIPAAAISPTRRRPGSSAPTLPMGTTRNGAPSAAAPRSTAG